jgi:transcriptional regulator with XRE-family HTH domain
MASVRLNNYLRTKRKHSGLSLSDVSFLVRLKDKSELSRYECNRRQPSLRIALACQELYGLSVSDLFAGFNDSVTKDTRDRMKRLRTGLQAKVRPQSRSDGVVRKLQWISQRLLEMPNFKLVQAI